MNGPAPPLPWRPIVRWAALGTLVTVTLVLADVNRTGRHPLNLVQPGESGPSAQVIAADFPDVDIPDGTGHDGQQLYAVARAPMHLDQVASHLDRPHYRLQRPLFPWLAWALHPFGGGRGLVLAMAAVGVLALLGGGVATGALAAQVGARPELAALFPLLPGSYVALRISAADHVALALLAAALALMLRGRTGWAVLAATGSVLAKEPMLAPLAALVLWRRDRRTAAMVAVPAGVAAAWAVVVRLVVDSDEPTAMELTVPFGGVVASVDDWVAGRDLWALGTLLATAVVVVVAVQRQGWRHPLVAPALAVAALTMLLIRDAVGLDLNATRIASPALLLAAVAAAAPPQPADNRWSRQPNRSTSGAGSGSDSG